MAADRLCALGRGARQAQCQLASPAAEEACCTSPLEFSGYKRGRSRKILASIVNHIPPSLNFGSFQCWACAVEFRRICSTCTCLAHQISTYCTARSRLCRLSGRLVTQVHRPDFQLHRRAHRNELLQCLHASVEICGTTNGEMQVGSRFAE